MKRKIWWVTRPTRDLHDIEEALRCFAGMARGKQWRGNRELHQRFEGENPAKTPNVGKHGSAGSGGRTWAAWLRMWGLWYNEKQVALTDGGNLIVSASDPVEVHNQIVHQIMIFQITSAYHERLKPGQSPGFEVFPFRFMLKMLLDERIRFLSVDEIGLFLLQVKKPSEHNRVARKILEWREAGRSEEVQNGIRRRLVSAHMSEYGNPRSDSPKNPDGYWRSIKDVANTLAVNISYIRELVYDPPQRNSIGARQRQGFGQGALGQVRGH